MRFISLEVSDGSGSGTRGRPRPPHSVCRSARSRLTDTPARQPRHSNHRSEYLNPGRGFGAACRSASRAQAHVEMQLASEARASDAELVDVLVMG